MELHVGASILSCDFSILRDECLRAMKSGSDWIHVDVMDHHFVPNLTLGAPIVQCLHKAIPDAFLDVHIMVDQPELYIEPMAKAGTKQLIFHIETTEKADELIERIHSFGMKAGICVNPETPVDAIYPYLDKVDLVQVMTVRPGFGGQSMIMEMLEKVKEVRKRKPLLNIQVDGGVNEKTAEAVRNAGANCFVSGAVFKVEDPARLIRIIRGERSKYKFPLLI